MKSKKTTKKAYEEYLNNLYSEMNYEDAYNQFEYLFNKKRELPLSINRFQRYFHADMMGYMLHKYDPITFNVGYNEFSLKKANYETRSVF